MDKTRQDNFVKRTNEHRKKIAEGLAYRCLAEFLRENINYYDVHYIIQRAIQIIEEAKAKVSFMNKEIAEVRKAFIQQKLKEIKDNVKSAPPVEGEKTLTDLRNIRCEPLAQSFTQMVLEESLVFSDEEYLSEASENDDELLLYVMIKGYIDVVYDTLIMTLAEHERRAFFNKWGCEKEEITMKMLDEALKTKPKKK